MSAITGIFYRDGRKVDPDLMKKMNDRLSHRGPDGSAIWCEESVGLGHQMLWTTPESLHETLPFHDKKAGLVITADARIDNRKELSEELDIEDKEDISDSYFILKAYEKWGEKCPEHLLGDFAFAIWDKENEKLFCARDHMGVKPFYYYLDDNIFVFGTEIKALFTIPKIDYVLNEKKLALHLLLAKTDSRRTFYQNILTLKAAHKLILNFKKSETIQYWKLDKDYRIKLNSDEEYIQSFHKIFTKAINCRLRCSFNIGFELSGGLDSSSVVCMAQKILNEYNNHETNINTYSLVFDELPQVDERFFIDKVIEISDYIKPNYVHSDNISPLENIDSILWHQEEPYYTINMSIFWNLYNQMKKNNIRIILTGDGGDETVISHEKNYLSDLAIKMEWKKLLIEINAYSKHSNKSKINLFYKIFINLIPNSLKNIYKKNNFYRRNRNNNFILNEDFVNKVGCKEYLKKQEFDNVLNNIKTFRDFHYFAINNNVKQITLEMTDRIASAFFMEPRYPFYDKRLIEFCYAIPDDMKFRFGWNRYILRISMDNILPKQIQWRSFKNYFDPVLKKNLLLFEKSRLDEIFNENSIITRYININILKNLYNNFNSGLTYKDQNNLWISIILYFWLINFKKNKRFPKNKIKI